MACPFLLRHITLADVSTNLSTLHHSKQEKYVLVSRAIRKCTLKDIPLENVALTKLLFGAFENKAMHNH